MLTIRRNMKKRNIKHIISIAVVLMVLLGAMLWKKVQDVKQNPVGSETDPVFYIERKLGIKLVEGVTLVEGKYSDDQGEEHIKAKFSVEKKHLEELEEELRQSLWEYELSEIPIYFKKKDICYDLREKKIVKYYNKSTEGKKVKTIEVEAFIAADDNKEYFF